MCFSSFASFSHFGVSSEQYPHDCRHTLTIHRCGERSSVLQLPAVSGTTVVVNGLLASAAEATNGWEYWDTSVYGASTYGIGDDNPADSYNLTPQQAAANFKILSNLLEELWPAASTRPKLIGPDVHGFLETGSGPEGPRCFSPGARGGASAAQILCGGTKVSLKQFQAMGYDLGTKAVDEAPAPDTIIGWATALLA